MVTNIGTDVIPASRFVGQSAEAFKRQPWHHCIRWDPPMSITSTVIQYHCLQYYASAKASESNIRNGNASIWRGKQRSKWSPAQSADLRRSTMNCGKAARTRIPMCVTALYR